MLVKTWSFAGVNSLLKKGIGLPSLRVVFIYILVNVKRSIKKSVNYLIYTGIVVKVKYNMPPPMFFAVLYKK